MPALHGKEVVLKLIVAVINKSNIHATSLLAIALVFVGQLWSQQGTAGWRVYTPADRSFRIQLPAGPVTELSSERGDLRNTLFEKGSTYYLWSEDNNETARFSVLVLDLKVTGITDLRKDTRWMDYLALMVLGDDDEPQYLSQPGKISENGLKGNEYKYIDPVGDSKMFSRGRLFDTGNELIVLIYKGADAGDLVSRDANQFFDSLEWTPKLKIKVSVPKSGSGTVVFRETGAKPLLVLNDANAPIISEDGSRILVMPEGDLAEVYEVFSGKKLFSIGKGVKGIPENPNESFGVAAMSADGRQVVIFVSHYEFLPNSSYRTDHLEIKVLDIDSGKQIDARVTKNCCPGMGQRFDDHRFIDASLTYLVGTHRIYSPPKSEDQKYGVLLSDLRTRTVIGRFGDALDISDDWDRPVITPDALLIAATRRSSKDHGRDATFVWNIKTQREVMKLPFWSGELDLAADGRRLATRRELATGTGDDERRRKRTDKFGLHKYVDTTPDYRTEVWDVESGRRISEIGAEFGTEVPWVGAFALSPDGDYLVTTRNDYALVWDTNTGRLIAAQPNEESFDGAKFSDDGKSLVLTSGEVVKVYRFADVLKQAVIIRQ